MSNVTPFPAALSAASSRSANCAFSDHTFSNRSNAQPQSRLTPELRAGLDQLEKDLQAFRQIEELQ
jgi:hypothetical protein